MRTNKLYQSTVAIIAFLFLFTAAVSGQANFVVTNLNDAGAGSLRDAIDQANSNPGADVISFQPGLSGTILLTTTASSSFASLSPITDDLTITGPGADIIAIDNSGLIGSGILWAKTRPSLIPATVNISGLKFANANSSSNGGAILGYAIFNIDNCVFSNNTAQMGGAIYTNGTLNLNNCSFIGNESYSGGAVQVVSGGISAATGCLFKDNGKNLACAAIQCSNTNMTISNSTFYSNGNISRDAGGAIANVGNGSTTLKIKSCTITGNQSVNGSGISNNSGMVELENTIVAGNTVSATGTGPDLYSVNSATFTSQGHNFIGIGDGITGFTDGVNNDQVGTAASPKDPILGTLQYYGGPTQTIALLPGSPALNTGACITAMDQRGITRPQGGACDIGAFENETGSLNLIVTNTNAAGPGSLNEALARASTNGAADNISFQPGLTGRINLATKVTNLNLLPIINEALTITGPGADLLTIAGDADTSLGFSPTGARLLEITATGTVNLSGLRFANAQSTSGGGLIRISNTTSVVNMSNCVFANGYSGIGGAILNGGLLNVTNSSFIGNDASLRGGAIVSTVSTTITGCFFTRNGYFFGRRGTINCGDANMTISNSTFFGNGTTDGDATIFHSGGSATALTIRSCTISGNAALRGGGVSNMGGVVQIENSIIAGNSTGYLGPDVYTNESNNQVTITSLGHNFIGISDGSVGFTDGVNNDQVGTSASPKDPLLTPPANNGGPTQTMALISNSPARNAGSCITATDQRGTARPQDGACDIGAFENEIGGSLNLIVTNTNAAGPGSLNEALARASTNGAADNISFQPGLTGTINLTTKVTNLNLLPIINEALTITGPGADLLTIAGDADTSSGFSPTGARLLEITATGAVNISGLKFANAYSSSGGGLIRISSTASVVNISNCVFANGNTSGAGGAISNSGLLNVTNSSFVGNDAGIHGGAIVSNLPATITGCFFTRNGRFYGRRGTIYCGDVSMTISNSTFYDNGTTDGEATIFRSGGSTTALTIRSCTIAGNTAVRGGGVSNMGGVVQIENSIIAGNSTGYLGPDVYTNESNNQVTITSLGHNFVGISDGSVGFTDGVNNDQVGTAASPKDPSLAPLADNGGPTQTMALQSGSPAIDAGSCITATDQRGIARPQGAACDIGAFEKDGYPTFVSITSSLSQSLTGSTVTFTATVTAVGYPIPFGTLDIYDAVTLIASAVPLDASGHATFTTNSLTEGTHILTANYSGGTDVNKGSGSVTQVVDNPTNVNGTKFSNTLTGITVPDNGTATPYASHIFVTGLPTSISKVTVTLNNISHSTPGDLDMLLVGPGGQKFIIMSDAGGTTAANNITLTLDDAAASSLSGTSLMSGTFKPTDINTGSDNFPAPSPAGPYNSPSPIGAATLASVFNGTDPNGTWSLYVLDDNASGTGGAISGGWSLDFAGAPVPTTTITVVSNINPSFTGNVVTFTATVASSGNPVTTGTVSFKEGAVTLSTTALNASGQATFTTSSLAEGSHIITASYNGAPVSSGSVTQVVNNPTVVNGNQFSNILSGINVPDNSVATPYSSNIFVSGLPAALTGITLTLNNFSHATPGDFDMLLVGPGGQKFVVLSDAGGSNAVNNLTLTLSDAAAASLPNNSMASGTFKPTDFNTGADNFPSPAPASPYNSAAPAGAATFGSVFNGINPNGQWSLYVVDDNASGSGGSISGGWSLTFKGAPSVTTVSSSVNPSVTGNAVTFTATVTSNGNPVTTGNINFSIGNTVQGSAVALNASGQAIFTTSSLTEGNSIIKAAYSGATGLDTSSGSVTQLVNNPTVVNGTQFSNVLTGINVPDNGVATPYASHIFVSGMPATMTNVTVTLNNISHLTPGDFDMVLVGPGGQRFIIMSDAGGTTAANNVTITLSDAAASSLSNTSLVSGTFKPADFNTGADNFPAPAPAGSYNSPSPTGVNTFATVFNGTNPNGEWSLFVIDDNASGAGGAISGGWSLNFAAAAPVATNTSVVSNLNPSFTGNVVTFTATVTSNGNPVTTGNVSFSIGNTVQGSAVALNASGQATFATSSLIEGNSTIKAAYNGAIGFDISSGTVVQVVSNPTVVNGTQFSNVLTGITVPDNSVATPYSSRIFVSGLPAVISKFTVTLKNITHPVPGDLDILLVGPGGQKFILMSDAGGSNAINNVTLTLDDAATNALPNQSLTTGTFRPTNYNTGTDNFPAPAPAGSYNSPAPTGTATLTSVFKGINPNGAWSLYVMDDNASGAGIIAGGWSLNFTACDEKAAKAGPDKVLDCNTTSVTLGSTYVAGNGYSWTTTGGHIVSGSATATPIVDLPGTYALTVTCVTNGCVSKDTAIVTKAAPVSCTTCTGGTVIVDTSVTINFNTNPPTYTGDQNLKAFYSFINTGTAKNLWKAVFNVKGNKLLVKKGVTITTSQVGGFAPGIEIRGTCDMEVQCLGRILVNSNCQNAGNILVQINGAIKIDGEIRNEVVGTSGLPGSITVSGKCGDMTVGQTGLVQVIGVAAGGADINLLTCGSGCNPGDITVSGLVKSYATGHGTNVALNRSNIKVVSFNGAVTVNTNSSEPLYDEFANGSTFYDVYGGLLSWVRDNSNTGKVEVQARKNVTVNGHGIDPTGTVRKSFGGIAAVATAINSPGGIIDVRSLEGNITASNRAFDVSGRNGAAANTTGIRLFAKNNISLSRPGATNNFNPVVDASVPVAGERGGTNELRSFAGNITIGANVQVSAAVPAGTGSVQGVNLLTACTGVTNSGTVLPADAVTADNSGTCGTAAPTALYTDCSVISGAAFRPANPETTMENAAPEIRVYPNPAFNKLNLDFNYMEKENYELKLLDINGRAILTKTEKALEGKNHVELDLGHVARGVYVLCLKTSSESKMVKIIVQ